MRTTETVIYPTDYGKAASTTVSELLNDNNLNSVLHNLIMHLGLTDEQVFSLMDNKPLPFDEYWGSEWLSERAGNVWPTEVCEKSKGIY